MGRQVSETQIKDRAARMRLKPRDEPYWRSIGTGIHLGYFRGKKAGKWVARLAKTSPATGYYKRRLGNADDLINADGKKVLDWRQALEKALSWSNVSEDDLAADPENDPDADVVSPTSLTVKEAVQAYIAVRNARDSDREGREVKSDAQHRLKNYVLDRRSIADVNLDSLTEANLRSWQRGLTGLKASSRQRLVGDFKAALNMAHLEHRRILPPDFATVVKFGFRSLSTAESVSEPMARDNQVLHDDQIRLIISAAFDYDADGDFARMVLLLAATGARFSQIRRMMVGDVQTQNSRLMVPMSRKGKGRTNGHIRVAVADDVIKRLDPVTRGRKRIDPLLERWRHVQVKGNTWERAERGPWYSAAEMTRPWREVVKRVKLPDIIPYALRHSSIVRSLGAGIPIRLVAAIHDTSVQMIERHYARWITESLDEIAARAVVPWVEDESLPGKPAAAA